MRQVSSPSRTGAGAYSVIGNSVAEPTVSPKGVKTWTYPIRSDGAHEVTVDYAFNRTTLTLVLPVDRDSTSLSNHIGVRASPDLEYDFEVKVIATPRFKPGYYRLKNHVKPRSSITWYNEAPWETQAAHSHIDFWERIEVTPCRGG